MKQSSKRRQSKSFRQRNPYWFGISVRSIALGTSFVGCLVIISLLSLFPSSSQQVLSAHISTTCVPRPACLDATPPCVVAGPADGWCVSGDQNHVPLLTGAPAGCFLKTICIPQSCQQSIICPSKDAHTNASLVATSSASLFDQVPLFIKTMLGL